MFIHVFVMQHSLAQELAHRTEVTKHPGRSIALISLAIKKSASSAQEAIVLAERPSGRGREQGKRIMKFWVLVTLAASALPMTSSHLRAELRLNTSFSKAEVREIRREADPFSMGRITLHYASGEEGSPTIGFRITDPRGRTIGYDPRINKGWQEMPLAQAFLDCDENEETGELRHCKGHIEICGPISGTYQVEVLPTRSSTYSMNASATSQRTRNKTGFHTTSSQADFKGKVFEQHPARLLLQYSREAGSQIKLTGTDQHLADRMKDADQGSD